MRVLIVNTSERTGGAAVAANRLMDALNNNGTKAKMLVRDKLTDDITVVGLKGGLMKKLRFLWERWCVFCHLHFSREHLFEVDIANTGFDITHLPEFKEADIIHLAWVNQGYLSLKGIRKILRSGKPVVWTMHDLWPATGICHYSRGCMAFKSQCRKCRLLPGGGSSSDLSTKVFRRKQKLLRGSGIHFVTCSKWLGDQAKQSALLTGLHLESIPNPIDTKVFRPTDKREARLRAGLPGDKRIVLFVSQSVTDKRKGMAYFIEAIEKLAAGNPETRDNTAVAILGGHSDELVERLPLPAYPLGFVSGEREITDIYNSADVFVIPSLEDNLPNTIMESMACGVPCVGFRTGGIPEMIDHLKNGYVAKYQSSDDLAAGISWVLDDADRDTLMRMCLQKVATNYSQRAVAMRYIEVYNQALAFKHYRI